MCDVFCIIFYLPGDPGQDLQCAVVCGRRMDGGQTHGQYEARWSVWGEIKVHCDLKGLLKGCPSPIISAHDVIHIKVENNYSSGPWSYQTTVYHMHMN